MLQGRHWIINPIDGREGFENLRQYGISLALLEQGKVIMACNCRSHAAAWRKHHSFHATVPQQAYFQLSDCHTSCDHGSCQWYWPQAYTIWFADQQNFGQ
jgi:3'-phosphoadenosine 5'-phosphosulfate (PAPS) 3'-phosphatase